jgi:fucose 4-O-acetylase-like acetyltransferase
MKIQSEAVKNNFQWMDIAKGIGISLVVIGHFKPESSPQYWLEINSLIYSFHMPLFFMLSGYLYNHGKYSYSDLMKSKVKRLLYPFATIAIIFFIIKLIAGRFVNLDSPVDIGNLLILLTNPVHSYMPLLWFVHALFLMFVLYPLLRQFLNNWLLLPAFIIIGSFVPADFPVLGRVFINMPFFIFGVALRDNKKLAGITVNSSWHYIAAYLSLFLLAYGTKFLFAIPAIYSNVVFFIVGVLGSLLAINISHCFSEYASEKINKWLLLIGFCSMTIYLFHTLFESMVRIGFIQVFKNIPIPFEITAFIAIVCGIVFPIILEKTLLRKYRPTRRFILGMD